MEITERIIIEQLKRGNEEAYKYLYRHHYALLCHIAREYVGDDFLAETLVGDVIFHLWEIHEALDIQVSLRSYLVRAVRNHCMDYLSSKKERTEVAFSSIPEEGEMRYLLSDDYPLGSLLEHELEEEIHHAIRNLPEVCRKVFIKSRFEGNKIRRNCYRAEYFCEYSQVSHKECIIISSFRTWEVLDYPDFIFFDFQVKKYVFRLPAQAKISSHL